MTVPKMILTASSIIKVLQGTEIDELFLVCFYSGLTHDELGQNEARLMKLIEASEEICRHGSILACALT